MSRIGKKPVEILSGVKVKMEGSACVLSNGKNDIKVSIPTDIACEISDKEVNLKPKVLNIRTRAMWGTCRALLSNAMEGLNKGFNEKLELKGVGYRAAVQGNKLNLTLGLSHPVAFDIPADVKISCPAATQVLIEGYDKQRVGQVAADIIQLRKPDVYRGHGIRKAGQQLFLKQVKKK